MTDADDHHARAGRASHAARGWRAPTDVEADHLRALGDEVQAARAALDTALSTRNDELRRLYRAGCGPQSLAQLLPPERGAGAHMSRVTVAKIVDAYTPH